MSDSEAKAIIASIMGVCVGIYLFVNAFKMRKRQLLIEATPTSKIRSVAVGQVELAGTVLRKEKPLVSPFSGSECAYYRCVIEELRRSGKSSHWVTIKEDISKDSFYLTDDTGKILVDPKDAEIEVTESFKFDSSWGKDPDKHILNYLKQNKLEFEGLFGANKSMRYTEYLLVEKQQVYALGYAGKNPHVKSSTRNEDLLMLQKGDDGNTFMISTKSEKDILSTLRWQVFGGWIGGGALAVMSLTVLFLILGIL